MELLQLKYFCDAAVSENFSKTAKKFFVPTSNISQSIKRLEREIGVELFEHHSNKIVLAESGKRFYEKVNAALVLLDEARTDAGIEDEEIHGEIKLLIFCNRRLVTRAIEKFKESYPNISFVLRHEQEAELDCDILITDKCPKGYYESDILADEDILLAMHRSHTLASHESISLRELENERFISMPAGRSLYTITTDICKSAGFTPNITIQTDDPHYVRKYVALSLGIAFVPSCSWDGLFSEDVVLKGIGDFKRTTYICLPKNKKIKPSVSAFMKYIKEQ